MEGDLFRRGEKILERGILNLNLVFQDMGSPDDTLKNVISIPCESQLSVAQRKKKKLEKINTDTTESKTKVAELIEPKSNELYARELAAKVVGH